MRIYHYTTINNLALILASKKIRFNRLDNVDDLEESFYKSGTDANKINICQYSFVSCWTKERQENLALWNMYTGYKGVRIGLESDEIFVKYKVNENSYCYFDNWFKIIGDIVFPLPNNLVHIEDIQYVNDVKQKIESIAKIEGNKITMNTSQIGIYKNSAWAFQKESRFILHGMPFNIERYAKDTIDNLGKESYSNADKLNFWFSFFGNQGDTLFENKPCKIQFIDLPIQEETLDNIEILMGPLTAPSDRIIVEALTKDFHNCKIVDSYFHGKIRK